MGHIANGNMRIVAWIAITICIFFQKNIIIIINSYTYICKRTRVNSRRRVASLSYYAPAGLLLLTTDTRPQILITTFHGLRVLCALQDAVVIFDASYGRSNSVLIALINLQVIIRICESSSFSRHLPATKK